MGGKQTPPRGPQTDAGIPGKVCRHCGHYKPACDFDKANAKPTGLHAWCKLCRRDDRLARLAGLI